MNVAFSIVNPIIAFGAGATVGCTVNNAIGKIYEYGACCLRGEIITVKATIYDSKTKESKLKNTAVKQINLTKWDECLRIGLATVASYITTKVLIALFPSMTPLLATSALIGCVVAPLLYGSLFAALKSNYFSQAAVLLSPKQEEKLGDLNKYPEFSEHLTARVYTHPPLPFIFPEQPEDAPGISYPGENTPYLHIYR